MSSRALREKFYREYMSFFEHAERNRRWNLWDDIPWDKLKDSPKNEKLALCAETFCGVEMYLPDYIAGHLELFRGNFARAWFAANWGYEESKHALTLREYLVRSGHRTEQQMFDYEEQLLQKQWKKPFDDQRQMTAYGALQEMATFVIYKKQEKLALAEGNEVLASIYKIIAKDEMAHCRFYERMMELHLDEDREGTLKDLAHVFRNFRMPAEDSIPNYESRIEVMRTAGIDRGVFLTEIWAPVLKSLKLTRHDLPKAWKDKPAQDAPVAVSV